ncbi:MAG TPA: hypothetical protein PKW37_05865 [Salinivirgaceae bacterium]|nr:hypothetical protein [Salinivirgaceae bacterium]
MFKKFKGLLIKETLWINTLRSMCTGLVVMIPMLIAQPEGMPFFAPLLFPISAPIWLLIFVIVAQVLKIVKLGGVGSIMCMCMTVPGDPLVFLLSKIKPEIVPVDNFKFINFAPLVLVYKDDSYVSASSNSAEENINDTGKCPFAGRVIGDKEGSVMGFSWPTKGTIFEIDENWNVISGGRKIGYIDRIGQIRKGLKGDPNATMSFEEIIGKIEHNMFYINNDKFGELVKW